MDIREYTIEELQKEIDRRKKIEEKPKLINEPDLSKLKTLAEIYIEGLAGSPRIVVGKSYKHQFYVICMKTFYGEEIFEWIRNNE